MNKYKNKLYIRFRNENMTYEIYASPIFESPNSLRENDDLDEFVVDGDGDFYINCDAEGNFDNNLYKIIWLMFEKYDPNWIKQLFKHWKGKLGFSLPSWDKWVKLEYLNEAYE